MLAPFIAIVALLSFAAFDLAAADDYFGLTRSAPPSLLQPHPFGVHDMVRMPRVGESVPSPNGEWIVSTVRTWDPDANKTTTNLWLTRSGQILKR